jgi:hypothetical protein
LFITQDENGNKSLSKFAKTSIWMFAAAIVLLMAWNGLTDTNEAGYISIRQFPVTGDLLVMHDEGMYFRAFGTVWKYKRAGTFSFGESTGDSASSGAIKVRFNDGGTADLYGNVRFRLPANNEVAMLNIHREYRSYEHLANTLIKRLASETLLLTASLMSAEDSYSGRRAEFMRLALDQLQNGNYQTESEEVEVIDTMTNEKKRVRLVKIKYEDDGVTPLRRENPLEAFNIEITQFILDRDFGYEAGVLEQIENQRTNYMKTVAAKAEATRSAQDAITAEAKGKADVAKAKYEKEVIKQAAIVEAEKEKETALIQAAKEKEKALIDAAKQKEVAAVEKEKAEIEAQKRLEVAKLDRAAAEETKQEQILIGEGEAERKRLVMEADGALQLKLEAWIKAQEFYADAVGSYTGNWVPQVVMAGGAGGSGTTSGGGANELIELLKVKTAKDLQLDLSMRDRKTPVTNK